MFIIFVSLSSAYILGNLRFEQSQDAWEKHLVCMQFYIAGSKNCLPYRFYWWISPNIFQTLSHFLHIFSYFFHTFTYLFPLRKIGCQRTSPPAMRIRARLSIRYHNPEAMRLRSTKRQDIRNSPRSGYPNIPALLRGFQIKMAIFFFYYSPHSPKEIKFRSLSGSLRVKFEYCYMDRSQFYYF